MRQSNIAYENLRVQMAVKQIRVKDLAFDLKISRDTMGKKLSRKAPIYLNEAFAIQQKHFPEMSVEYLFQEIFLEGEHFRPA